MLKIHTTPTPYWTKVIEEAKERKARDKPPFTSEQILKAASWVTCVCGRQDYRITRLPVDGSHGGGAPVDNRLKSLGCNFYFYVVSGDVATAEQILEAIELRAAQVLMEERAK